MTMLDTGGQGHFAAGGGSVGMGPGGGGGDDPSRRHDWSQLLFGCKGDRGVWYSPNREKLHIYTRNLFSPFAGAVRNTNQVLDVKEIGLEDVSYNKLTGILQEVETGLVGQTNAHLREAAHWLGRAAVNCLATMNSAANQANARKTGRSDAGLEQRTRLNYEGFAYALLGFALNTLAAGGSAATQANARKTGKPDKYGPNKYGPPDSSKES